MNQLQRSQRSRLRRLLALIVIIAFSLPLLIYAPADARGCTHSGQTLGNFMAVSGTCKRSPSRATHSNKQSAGKKSQGASAPSIPGGTRGSSFTPEPVCVSFSTATACGGTSRCQLQQSVITGFWAVDLSNTCARTPAPAQAAAVAAVAAGPPQVTPGMVLSAMRTIGLPSLEALTQPDGKTLVNFPTIFYTRPSDFTRTVTLLGQPVTVHASPVAFTWHHGDQTVQTTSGPGSRYPAMDVIHEYSDAHVTVRPRVDVTYAGRFRVAGGGWRAIPGTVTITGPSSPLRISEATPVLSGDHR
jgi:hypothetical protein